VRPDIGNKTEQSERRVPLPAGVLAYLPKAIKGPLFKGDARSTSKRLNRFMNECGIVDPRKVVHSLRHRAQGRLRAAGCPEDVRWAILGHEEKTVAAGYGGRASPCWSFASGLIRSDLNFSAATDKGTDFSDRHLNTLWGRVRGWTVFKIGLAPRPKEDTAVIAI
jgi:hypothetical protein